MSVFETAGEEAIGPTGELVLEEQGEEVGEGELIGLALDQTGVEIVGDPAEAEVAQDTNEVRKLHRHHLLLGGRDLGGGRGNG